MNEEQIKNLKGALEKKPSKMPLRRHRDDDYYDRIIVVSDEGPVLRASIVPRYKTSGMSGDQWRISARLEVYAAAADATPVFAQGFGRMCGLVEHAPHFLWKRSNHLLWVSAEAHSVSRVEKDIDSRSPCIHYNCFECVEIAMNI